MAKKKNINGSDASVSNSVLVSCSEFSQNWRFAPIDTWFFRESKPHDSVGGNELGSLFPPPVRTLLGAIRTKMGDAVQLQWQKYNSGDGKAHCLSDLDMIEQMGQADDLGKLTVSGPWVHYNNQRYYPVPSYLMVRQQNDQINYSRLIIGPIEHCDLGRVSLPVLAKELAPGFKNCPPSWVTHSGLEQLLKGGVPQNTEVLTQDQIIQYEPRLGIAIQQQSRTVFEGKLYQTQHIRAHSELSMELDIHHIDPQIANCLSSDEILRLGGEGRMSSLNISKRYQKLPDTPKLQDSTIGVILHLVTAADFSESWLPPGFVEKEINGQTVWQGKINNISLQLEAATIGKPYREGGWDMKNHCPRPVKDLVPAGSAYYCKVLEQELQQSVLDHLQGVTIGDETEYGRGQIVVGLWNQ